MPRQTKEIELGGRKVTVTELTVRDIKAMWNKLTGFTPQTAGLLNLGNALEPYWDMCIKGISLADLDDFAPSELKALSDAFLEVNAVFFDLALQVEGENPVMRSLRLAIMSDLYSRYLASSSEGTKESGTTDTPSS